MLKKSDREMEREEVEESDEIIKDGHYEEKQE